MAICLSCFYSGPSALLVNCYGCCPYSFAHMTLPTASALYKVLSSPGIFRALAQHAATLFALSFFPMVPTACDVPIIHNSGPLNRLYIEKTVISVPSCRIREAATMLAGYYCVSLSQFVNAWILTVGVLATDIFLLSE
jgi:hypothetical protein